MRCPALKTTPVSQRLMESGQMQYGSVGLASSSDSRKVPLRMPPQMWIAKLFECASVSVAARPVSTTLEAMSRHSWDCADPVRSGS